VGAIAVSAPNSLIVSLTTRLDGIVAGCFGFLVVALVASSAGGYQSTTWGWTALVTLWLAAVALLVRERIELRKLDLMYLGGLMLFGGWVAVSNLWTPSVPSTMHEVQRNLAYIGVVAAGLVLARASTTRHLLGGVLIAIVLLDLYGLGTRLLPDRLGTFDSVSFEYRLAPPITYWNGLGIFTVIGILLALGFAARARYLVTRVTAAAALPILAATAYFTFSRASWFALCIGLAAAAAIDFRRLQLIAVGVLLAPWSILAISAAEGRAGLTTRGATIQQATNDGHGLVPVLAVLAVGAASAGLAAAVTERHVRVPQFARYAFAAMVTAALVASCVWAWNMHGSPVAIAERTWNAFQAPPTSNDDVSARLLTFSSNGRLNLWGVSLDRFEAAPLLGEGAGTYWQAWARYRDLNTSSAEAHSLYFEVLGELGVVGLLLLMTGLVSPVLGAFRARGRELIPLAFGAYVAWAAHAGVDWDWELIGITIPALLCGCAILAAGREGVRPVATSARVAGATLLVVLSLASLPALLSDLAVASGYRQLEDARLAAARESARTASRWAPWAAEPRVLAGDVLAREGRRKEALDEYRAALGRDGSSWILWLVVASKTQGEERARALARMRLLNPRVPT
jgi:O-antigen ligase